MSRLFLLIISAVAFCTVAAQYRRVCYYTNWSQYRNGIGKFYPENVDASLCTHIIYAFAKLDGNNLAAFEWNDESTPWMKGMYDRFAALKVQNPILKLLLAVGGWNMGSAPFTQMVATDSGRRAFASTTVKFLRQNNFDGLDMDWEYPANRGSPPQDRDRYTTLLQVLHNEFSQENIPAGKDRLMLTAAVSAGKEKIDTGYDIPEISKYLDMINLMAYDFHGSWDDHTGHHAGLFSRAGETGNSTFLNVDWASQYWVQKGAPKAKLNIGLAFYGRSFKLPWGYTSDNVGCPAAGAGLAGSHTNEAGYLAYYEICEKLANGATERYINDQKVPYLVQGDLWVGYDDPDSLKIKVDYIKQHGFGGIMVWALDVDDFTGACGLGKYPLMRSIIHELNSPGNPVIPPVVTSTNRPTITHSAPTVTFPPMTTHHQLPHITTTYHQIPHITTVAPQTTPSNKPIHQFTPVNSIEFDCFNHNDGYYQSPYSCTHYYICVIGLSYKTDCHPGLLFNKDTLYCDFPDHVNCNVALPAVSTTASITTTTTHSTLATHKPVTTHSPMTTTTTGTIVNVHDYCKGKLDGFYTDPQDCSFFYQCSFEVASHETCPSGTYFSLNLQGCDWAGNVPNCP